MTRALPSPRNLNIRAALLSSGVATFVFLFGYYATLGLLPPATAYPPTELPVSLWAHRFDLAQFFGSLLVPPTPTLLTWLLGFGILLGTLVGAGLAYAFVLSWAIQRSDALKGAGFGVGFFLILGLLITVANGYHPAILRNALPDTGLMLLGWSGWATIQLLVLFTLYGTLVGRLYERINR